MPKRLLSVQRHAPDRAPHEGMHSPFPKLPNELQDRLVDELSLAK
jgi:hypothetical protein